MAYMTKDGKQYLNIKALHDRYGDLVRVGPNEVSIRTVDAVIPILGATGENLLLLCTHRH
jgi:hypothetical protein